MAIPIQELPMPTAKAVQARAKVGASFAEVGRSGVKIFGGYVLEEFLRTLQGQQGVRVYREMRDNDPIVGACMYAIESVIRQASWFVKPASSSAKDMKAAEFLGQCMDDMSHSWSDFISDVMTFLTYGWAWFEVVHKVRKGHTNDARTNSKFSDGMIGWRKIAIRKQSSLMQWEIDDSGGIDAMTQQAPPEYKPVTIPIEKSLLFRVSYDGNNPEGKSMLRNAYKPWYFKKQLEMLEAIGIERDLVGLPVIKPPEGFDIDSPENADVRQYVNNLIANLRRDEQEGILLPPLWEITLLSMGVSRRQFNTNDIINRYDKRIAVTTLAQFIMLGMDRVGSFALSKDQNEFFMLAVQSILNSISDTLNRFAVPKLMRMNTEFASLEQYPTFVPGRVSTPNLRDLSQYINVLAQGGILPDDDAFFADLVRVARVSEPSESRLGEVYKRQASVARLTPPVGQKGPNQGQEPDASGSGSRNQNNNKKTPSKNNGGEE